LAYGVNGSGCAIVTPLRSPMSARKPPSDFAGGGQAFRDAFGARPARLAGRALALALVEGGGVEAGAARESRSRQAMLGSQTVQGAPDFRVTQHVQSSLLI
jgi:hypothetical protein